MDDYELDEALQRALDRLALLADLSEALAGTLDEREGLTRVCRLLAQRLGDWCAVDLIEAGTHVVRVCAATRDAGLEPSPVEDGSPELPWSPQNTASPWANALRGGRPVRLDRRELRELPAEGAWERAFAEETRRRAITSAIVAPLAARREVLGLISLGRGGAHPPLGETESTLLQVLVHRVGLALDHARLYADAENIAERLQRSMLPELPHLPGAATAARYTPSGTAAQVGGDWYDLFPLPDGAGTALIVGDVVGHDLHAAVMMSQIRNMLRGIACDRQEPPHAIVHRLDTAVSLLYPDTYATCVYGVLHAQPGDRATRLDYTCAGHPPPLLISPDGRAVFLDAGRGPLLGVDPQLPRASASAFLPAGGTLLLYSDGLVERRGEPLDLGLTRLRRNASGLAQASPDELCDRLLAAQAPDTSTGDDVVLLAVRLTGTG